MASLRIKLKLIALKINTNKANLTLFILISITCLVALYGMFFQKFYHSRSSGYADSYPESYSAKSTEPITSIVFEYTEEEIRELIRNSNKSVTNYFGDDYPFASPENSIEISNKEYYVYENKDLGFSIELPKGFVVEHMGPKSDFTDRFYNDYGNHLFDVMKLTKGKCNYDDFDNNLSEYHDIGGARWLIDGSMYYLYECEDAYLPFAISLALNIEGMNKWNGILIYGYPKKTNLPDIHELIDTIKHKGKHEVIQYYPDSYGTDGL